MKRMFGKGVIALSLITALVFLGCPTDTDDSTKSSAKAITKFTLENVAGTINETAHVITVSLPTGTTKTEKTPVITVSDKASIDKAGVQDFTNDVTYTVTAEDGTSQEYTVKVNVYSNTTALVNTVWGGQTPQAGNTGWVTVTFRADSKVVFAFSSDNTTNLWSIIDNTATATKVEYPYILAESNASWMGPFKIDGDTKTLVFNSWMNAPRTLNRLRAADYTLDANPFTPAALPADLVNTVWAGETPQDSGHGWLTIAFKADGKVICSFSFDNSTNEWAYTYDVAATPQGTITNPSGWAPTPDGFTISDNTLTIVHYGSHAGDPRTFTRLR